MANNIAVSVTADVADLTAKRAILSSELKAASADLNNFAKTARTSGLTDELKTQMLASAGAVAKLKTEVAGVDAALRPVREHVDAAGASLKGLGEAVGVFVVAEAVSKAAEAFDRFEKGVEGAIDQLAELNKTAEILGVSTAFLQQFNYAARQNDIDVKSADGALKGLNESLGAVQANLPRAKQLAETFKALGFTPDQLRQYHDAGELLPVLADRISHLSDAAERAAIARKLGIAELIPMLNQGADGFSALAQKATDLGLVLDQSTIQKAEESKRKLSEISDVVQSKLNVQFAEFAGTLISIKEKFGEAEVAGLHFLAQLTNTESPQQTIKDMTAQLHDLQAMDKNGIAPSHVDLYRQITVHLQEATKALEAQHALQHDVSASAEDRATQLLPDKPHGKAPSIVSEWQEELHAQEIASGEFFKDQTADELKFWQDKLGLTRTNSREWLDVQSKIYDASRALAHQGYDEQLAGLNEKLQADRDNWSQERADWNAKLEFIKAHYGAESAQYRTAYRESEAAEREHTQRMAEIAKQGAQAHLNALRADLAAGLVVRRADAQSAEAVLNQQAQYQPLGEIKAALQIAALHRQLAQQETADDQAVYNKQSAILDQEVSSALAAFGAESTQYKAATSAKEAADQDWARRKKALLDQTTNQEIADQLKVKQAWHSYIDPLVSSVGQNMKGLIEGTETWGEALRNIGESIIDVIEQALVRMVENWIVNLITGQATATATNVATAQSYVGVAYAAGVASMAGAPFPIDLTAPAFGAEMAGIAEIGVGMASLDVGTNAVPNDMIAKIHKDERVMPAADNRALMRALDAGGEGGGVHHHHYNFTIHALDGADVQRVLERNHSAHAAAMDSLVRRRNGRGFGAKT